MHVHRFPIAALLLLTAACPAETDSMLPQPGGRFRLIDESTARTILSAPALAHVCERDSTIGVVVVGSRWAAAIGIRHAWPPPESLTVALGGRLAADSALLSARAVGDSVHDGWISRQGSLSAHATDATLGGALRATLLGSGADTLELSGAFDNIPIVTGRCP